MQYQHRSCIWWALGCKQSKVATGSDHRHVQLKCISHLFAHEWLHDCGCAAMASTIHNRKSNINTCGHGKYLCPFTYISMACVVDAIHWCASVLIVCTCIWRCITRHCLCFKYVWLLGRTCAKCQYIYWCLWQCALIDASFWHLTHLI